MTTTHVHRRRRRRVLAATVAAGAALTTGTSAALAEPPAVTSTVELFPDTGVVWEVETGGDLMFLGGRPAGVQSGAVYQRAIDDGGSAGVDLGPLALVGRTVADGLLAQHEDTLAYVRAVDRRLVLRAPDGTETLPWWGGDERLAGGVAVLTADWLVGADNPYEHSYTLFDRASGATYDLADLVEIPAELRTADDLRTGVSGVAIDFEIALFGVYASGVVDGSERIYSSVHAVELGDTGPTGEVTTLAETTSDGAGASLTTLAPVGLDGSDPVWRRDTCGAVSCTTTVEWWPDTEAPVRQQSIGDRRVVSFYRGALTTARSTPGGEVVEVFHVAYDGLDSETVVDVPGWAVGRDSWNLLAWGDAESGRTMVTDLWGLEVTADPTPVAPAWPFSDLDAGGAFTDEVLWLYDRGVVGGHADGTFRNLASVTREAMAAFLYRAANGGGRAPACADAPFVDVPVSHPFCGEIAWLADAGVSTGWEDDTFRPGQPVTREAMAAFLYRLAEGGDAPSCTDAPFADVSTGHPFCGAIAWMAEAGISTGWDDDTYRPGLTIERQAMAAFLFRFIDGGYVPTA